MRAKTIYWILSGGEAKSAFMIDTPTKVLGGVDWMMHTGGWVEGSHYIHLAVFPLDESVNKSINGLSKKKKIRIK